MKNKLNGGKSNNPLPAEPPLTLKEKLDHCIKRLPELAKLLDDAWEESNDFALNEDKAGEVQEQIQSLFCEITDHNFTFDQCGYWQHQYCTYCNQGKYPDLVVQNCGQLREKMGRMTEEEYLTKQI